MIPLSIHQLDDTVDLDFAYAQVSRCLVADVAHSVKRASVAMDAERDVWYSAAIPSQSPTCDPTWVPSEHPLFLLYTSGSTGQPKGVQHNTGGYMVYAATTCKYVFDMHAGDIYWCTADCGWITGHTYLTYGPLLNGAPALIQSLSGFSFGGFFHVCVCM